MSTNTLHKGDDDDDDDNNNYYKLQIATGCTLIRAKTVRA